jgi:hypothetical protein
MGFESSKPDNLNPNEVESPTKDRKGAFEKLYKSKTARAIALATAIFGGAAIEQTQSRNQDIRLGKNVVATEALNREGFRLEDLSGKFELEAQVPGGEKMVLHIGQQHITPEMEARPDVRNEVISWQKHIEELLSYLVEKGITDTVYVEGITDRYKESLDNVKNLANANFKKYPDNAIADSALIGNYVLQAEQLKANGVLQEKAKADWLYAAKCELERQYVRLRTEYEKFQKTGIASERYQKTFEYLIQEKINLSESIERVKRQADEIGTNELLRDGNVYLWGAAEKMYAEGKIQLKPLETPSAQNKTMAPYTIADHILSFPDFGYKPAYRHRIREDAALNLIDLDRPEGRVIPMVFGAGHNFTESVEAINEKDGHIKLGLTKLTPIE